MNIDTALILGGVATIFLGTLVAAYRLEGRHADKAPQTLPYTWGYWTGCSWLVWSSLLGTGLLATSKSDDAVWVGMLFLVLAIPGYYVIKRRRWAWIVVTILSFSPILWIAHWIYGRNRWAELEAEAGARVGSRNRLTDWIQSLHMGKVGILWGGAFGLLLFLYAAFPSTVDRRESLQMWILFIGVPLLALTWKWLTGREHAGRYRAGRGTRSPTI